MMTMILDIKVSFSGINVHCINASVQLNQALVNLSCNDLALPGTSVNYKQ